MPARRVGLSRPSAGMTRIRFKGSVETVSALRAPLGRASFARPAAPVHKGGALTTALNPG